MSVINLTTLAVTTFFHSCVCYLCFYLYYKLKNKYEDDLSRMRDKLLRVELVLMYSGLMKKYYKSKVKHHYDMNCTQRFKK